MSQKQIRARVEHVFARMKTWSGEGGSGAREAATNAVRDPFDGWGWVGWASQ